MSKPPNEVALLKHEIIEKLAERSRLEPMPHKWCPIADDLSGLKDPPDQRPGSRIEDGHNSRSNF